MRNTNNKTLQTYNIFTESRLSNIKFYQYITHEVQTWEAEGTIRELFKISKIPDSIKIDNSWMSET